MKTAHLSRKALGKGLDAIIPDATKVVAATEARQLSIDEIRANPFQPRHHPDQGLTELAASIRENGVIQPIVVRRRLDGFELIVGERRLRAARLAGLTQIPAVVKDASEPKMLELALTENIQRADLDPIEAALAYKRLADEFNLTHEQIAEKVGKSRSTVTNSLRLLALPERVRDALSAGQITEGHARALLAITNRQTQEGLCARIIAEGLSVRALERMSGTRLKRPKPARPRADPNLLTLVETLQQHLGTRVHLRQRAGQGEIVIEFHGDVDRERILALLLGTRDEHR
jgi:ParB family chromosome partitioning protein